MIAGAIFGLLAIPLGLFAGLQISTALGNVLLFPAVFLSVLTDTPFGLMSGGLQALAIAFSCTVWALVFDTLAHLFRRRA